MSQLDLVKDQIGHLVDEVYVVLDKAIMSIPPDQMDFRPTPDTMSAKELAWHIYETAYVLARSTELGEFRTDHATDIPCDLEGITTPTELVAFGDEVRGYLRKLTQVLRQGHLDRVISKDWAMTGCGR